MLGVDKDKDDGQEILAEVLEEDYLIKMKQKIKSLENVILQNKLIK
jgi:hypothetical protein